MPAFGQFETALRVLPTTEATTLGPPSFRMRSAVSMPEGLPDFLATNKTNNAASSRISGKPCQPSRVYAVDMNTSPIAGIGRRLKAIRDERGLTPAAMADWLGVSRTRYSNWENDQNRPAEEKMAWLCDQTGLTMDYIYRGKLDAVPMALAIRLAAREQGQVPDEGTADLSSVVQAALEGARKA
ncbi:helix-turn-helix domain-containing protein [Roseomonas xinghualingensis]|uniref:helix-turn-helix domain-containing protein n=1 Tax=Roseomonas xinghualingensis TaxID=2986475 RepID=UPI0021F175E3|nr:helix-turn-helix transcriptional regulator [Roseomonas sp. SXEYE001]MCV4209357.1 helix-turn-helix domain-containing protein [Roseomonas sp. SXEYE001]